MLYSEFVIKAKEETIEQADNGLWYLNPDWRYLLHLAEIDIRDVSDYAFDWFELEEILKLEVERRNTVDSVKPQVLNWFHSIISNVITPKMDEEETDYLANITEYLKAKKEAQEAKDKEAWDKFKKS